MRRILLVISCLAAVPGGLKAQAQNDLVISVGPTAGNDGTPLGTSFAFPDTTVGGTPSSQVMRLRNKSATVSYEVTTIYFSTNGVFAISGTFLDKCVVPGGNEDFTATFTPTSETSFSTTLLVSTIAFGAGSGCSSTGGVSSLLNWATFTGSGVAPVIGTGGSGGGVQSGELSLTYLATSGATNTLAGGTTFDFGRVQEGKTLTQVLALNNSSNVAVTVPPIATSGVAFSIVGNTPNPLVIQAGSSYSFTLQFAPLNPTPYSGALTIGAQSIGLTGLGFAPPFPAVTLSFNPTALGNQQQDQVTVNLASAAPYKSVGTLSMQFTPSSSVSAVDNAIVFTATGGQNLTVTFAQGAAVGTYNGTSAFTFQTGTTAGTLTFTFTMQGSNTITQSFTLAPSVVQITASSGKWQSPSLLVNLTGYDNSYSAGKMVFTFYGANGAVLTPGGMTVDATSTFQPYFNSEKGYGGAFVLQANFPVTGYSVGPSCMGVPSPPANCMPATAVDVTIQNSAGPSAVQHITFQ